MCVAHTGLNYDDMMRLQICGIKFSQDTYLTYESLIWALKCCGCILHDWYVEVMNIVQTKPLLPINKSSDVTWVPNICHFVLKFALWHICPAETQISRHLSFFRTLMFIAGINGNSAIYTAIKEGSYETEQVQVIIQIFASQKSLLNSSWYV